MICGTEKWDIDQPKHYQTYPVSFQEISNRLDICDVCLREKQTRLPFSASEHKVLMNFDLVHCDI